MTFCYFPLSYIYKTLFKHGTTIIFAIEIACKYQNATLECPTGSDSIDILYVHYGRYDLTTCSPSLKKNCAATNAWKIVVDKCQSKKTCTVESSDSVFGDPCSGVDKYLHVDYQCTGINSITITFTVMLKNRQVSYEAKYSRIDQVKFVEFERLSSTNFI